VVTHHTDSTAVVQAAEEKASTRRLPLRHVEVRPEGAPHRLHARLGDFYTKAVGDALAGTWKTTNVWAG